MTQDYQTGLPSNPQGSTTQTAKDQAANVAHSAASSSVQLVDEAKTQAGEVGREATRQAKGILDQGRAQLTEQASQQQKKVAVGVRSFGEELHSMARASDEPGMASDLAHQIAARADSVATWLEAREPGALLDEVKEFARAKPGTFLAIAAGAGLLAGRLTRGIKDATDDPISTTSGTGTGTHRLPGAPSTGLVSPSYGTGTTSGTPTYGLENEAATGAYGSTAGGSASAGYGTGQYGAGSYSSSGAPTTSGSSDDTMVYPTTGAAIYEEVDTYAADSAIGGGTYAGSGTHGDRSPDSYGGGTENPPSDTPAYGTEEAGVFGGGTTDVPEHEAGLGATWPRVHGEDEQR